MDGEARIPDPALLVLVGPAGSGKSTWAAARYRPAEIVSSDHLRSVVGSGEADLDASADAFEVLELVVRARAGRGLATVVDTLGLDPARRQAWRELARASGLPAVAVHFDTPAAVCRSRNAAREVPVPAPVLARQLRKAAEQSLSLDDEGWDLVVRVAHEGSPQATTSVLPQTNPPAPGAGLGFILQLSAFPWGQDPAAWLTEMARAAHAAGFEGVALMDHLIQIPQVGRAWDPIPEPFTTLGLLAGAAPGLRLGTLVTPVTYRPAGVLAKTVATLDALTGGRAFCGIGAGWWGREHAAYGLGLPSAGARLDALETAIETLRALWAPGTKAYAGERVALPETTCYPRPGGPIPIIVGGGGERRTLRIAARWGDACNVVSADAGVLERKIGLLRRHCADVGRDPSEVAVTVLDTPIMGRDRDAVASAVERLRGRAAAPAFAKRHHAGVVADHLRRYAGLAGLGVSTVFVAPQGLRHPDDLAPWAEVTGAFRA